MTESVALRPAPARFWPQGWWKVVEFRIGIVPLPVYVVLAALMPPSMTAATLPCRHG